MDVTPGPVVHTVRANGLEYDGIWRLGPDALALTGGSTAGPDVTVEFPYSAISEIRLSFAPTRFDWARYRCDLRLANGQTIAILSTHYASIGDFEDRAASYVPLVRGLIARVAAANPACRIRAGKRPLVYFAEHAFLLAMMLLLALVIGLVGGVGLSGLVLIKLGILAAYIPLMIVYTRKNWPRRLAPAAIPAMSCRNASSAGTPRSMR